MKTSAEAKTANPRKRGRPRKNSNLEPEQNPQVKRPKSDVKNDLQSTQKLKKSAHEKEIAEKTYFRPSNNRKIKSANFASKIATSTPVQKTFGRQTQAKSIKEKKATKSAISYDDDDDDDDEQIDNNAVTATKPKSKQKTQKKKQETTPPEEILVAPKEKIHSTSRSKQSRKRQVINSTTHSRKTSAELSDSPFDSDQPKKSNIKKTKKSSNSLAESLSFEEEGERSKTSQSCDDTSSIGRKTRPTNKHSKIRAALTSVVLDSASESDMDDASKSNSSQGNRKKISNRASKSSKAPMSDYVHGSSEHSIDEVKNLSTKSNVNQKRRDEVELPSVSDGDFDGWQSDREFLQQQVNILMTPFEVTDCPELAAIGKGTVQLVKDESVLGIKKLLCCRDWVILEGKGKWMIISTEGSKKEFLEDMLSKSYRFSHSISDLDLSLKLRSCQ